jgi:hypothetical protein
VNVFFSLLDAALGDDFGRSAAKDFAEITNPQKIQLIPSKVATQALPALTGMTQLRHTRGATERAIFTH